MAPRFGNLVWVLGLVLTVSHGSASAQCDPGMSSGSPAEVFRKDLRGIFGALGGKPDAATDRAAVDSDRLIVPGSRVGPFELNVTFSALKSKVKVTTPKEKSDRRYEWILPLGYVPIRKFSDAVAGGISFAFTSGADRLAEILVREAGYATAEGIRVGSPASELKHLSDLKRPVTVNGESYLQGEGITVIVREGKIIEIVVRKR